MAMPVQAPDGKQVQHIPWDFKFHAKRRGAGILADLAPLIGSCLDDIGLFVCPPAPPTAPARRIASSDWVRLAIIYSGGG